MIRALRCAAVLLAALWTFGVEEAAAQASVSEVVIRNTNAPISANTFGFGEVIRIEVNFQLGAVLMPAAMKLEVEIGSATRQFDCTSTRCGHATLGGSSWNFTYTVQAGDADTDGIRVQRLTGGTATRVGGGTVNLTIPGSNDVHTANYLVDGALGVAVSGVALNSPLVGDTYGVGEVIEVTVTFTGAVDVTGNPRVRMRIGSNNRDARYATGHGTTSLVFRYTVVAADTDANGLAISATNGLRIGSGTTIRASGTTRDAVRSLAGHLITDSANHKVAGGSSRVTVSGVALNSPLQGGTYGLGEVIEATVTFAAAVNVTGTPQLALTVGQNTRQADYDRGHGTTALVFGYTVIAADADTDGISIAASALTLNSGTIRASGTTGTVNAVLGLGSSAITNSTLHKVDGQTIIAPGVHELSITSRPRAGGVYRAGEEIEVGVTFSKAVDVTGTPQLALGIGAVTRQADYGATGSTARMLAFSYTVVVGDLDEDGFGVATNALTLNGGSINDASSATTAATLSLAGLEIGNAVGHLVNVPDDRGGGGGGPPPSQVTGVRVSPLDGGLRVSWAAASGSVSQYRVDVADASGALVRRAYSEAGVLEAVVDGLANGVEYTVTVTAVPGHGGENGPPSESQTVTPQAGAGDPDGGAGEPGEVPVPALPLAGAGILAGLLASAAYRFRSAGRRA